jgi:hypothetical protein
MTTDGEAHLRNTVFPDTWNMKPTGNLLDIYSIRNKTIPENMEQENY